ncbi:SIS domain-containing protein [Microlunatus flavus]|uniref:Phospho-glucose isomerase C-terminal SIS domain-containing protein n=1 Tax=Microlunatus flavus TaxID=1036181 RepID=A0A1H9CIJ3_9ACTN|nr:SIS domain-containing protein [Microlunatus flavus]SEQ01036.1 phospho-glucose isomerase C-terminal SIS domain-containing protein [Microlunatus flavus]
MTVFDDSALDDAQALAGADAIVRRLAEAGSRVRRETADAGEPIDRLRSLPRPRALVAAGSEARFIRAILEPVCPVPLVAWPHHGLPGWVGALDLVVVMASDVAPASLMATVHEAVRRGAMLLIACPASSLVAEHAAGSSTVLLPTATADPFAAAVVALDALHTMDLGPAVDPEAVAATMDEVARDCSPYADVSENPAKDLALCMADAQPLVWGGSTLAARASRRVAEALRAASGRAALAADADALLPIVEATTARDPFADPFTDGLSADRRPCLVLLDDGNSSPVVRADHGRLVAAAERADVRASVVQHRHGSDVERYAALLQTGMFAAVYLSVGLGRTSED